jgi:hypothetical protein
MSPAMGHLRRMKWIDALEKKFGHLAIPGLVRIIVFLNAFVFILTLVNPHFLELIYLDPALVMKGQVWRLFSYILIPSLGRWWLMPDYLWLVFWLMFVWMLGEGLEHAWGSFKLNIFYLIGMLGTTVAAFVFGDNFNNGILNLSLLFAFATIYPDYPIRLFLIIPVKIKWIAWFSFGGLCLSFLGGSMSLRMAIVAGLANYLIFFAGIVVHDFKHRNAVTKRRQRFLKEALPADEALHHCEVCRRTEISHPDLDFRVSADGNEYCVEHLPKLTAG